MLGTSLVAQRAFDIQRGFHLLASRPGVDRQRIYGAGQGNAAPALLHAAAAGVPFARLLLDDMVASYRSIAESPIHRDVFESIVPGAIRHYDLPGLATLLGPRAVIVVDATSSMGVPLTAPAAQAAFKSAPNVRTTTRRIDESPALVYPQLLN